MRAPFRIDRAVSVHLTHPLFALRQRNTKGRVPILMYHGVNNRTGGRHPYFETNTSLDVFSTQMDFLVQNNCAAVDLGEAVNAIEAPGDRDCKVVITFDDGYIDFYDSAFPILAERALQATLFIVTDLTGAQRISKDGKEYMNWREVREVHARGIRIGSHSVSHGKLWSMTSKQIDDELHESKSAIEDKLGAAVESFAYPYAFPAQDKRFVEFLRDRLQAHGYQNGVATTIGTARAGVDRYFLPRLPMNTFDDEALFRVKIDGGYDWLWMFQHAKKVLRAGLS